MDEQSQFAKVKQRLVGTLFLLLVVVLIVFLLLYASKHGGTRAVSGQPAATQNQASQVEPALVPLPAQTPGEAAPAANGNVPHEASQHNQHSVAAAFVDGVSGNNIDLSSVPADEQPPSANAEAATAAQPAAPGVSGQSEVADQFGQVPASSVTKAPAKIVSKATVKKATAGGKNAKVHAKVAWVVKLGSFASPMRAKDLSDKVRGQGYKVYTTLRKTNKGVLTQVFAGPMPTRDAAQKAAAKLLVTLKVKGVVVKK